MSFDLLLRHAHSFRVVYIAGRYGSGKSLTAFALARSLLSAKSLGYRYILSNVNSIWCDDLEAVVPDPVTAQVDAILILDEAGQFIESAKAAKNWLAALRKLNITLILPTVVPPVGPGLKSVSVYRSLDLSFVGLDLWLYTVDLVLSASQTETYKFSYWFPSRFYGVYDTAGYPTDADNLLSSLGAWTKNIAKIRGYQHNKPVFSAFSALEVEDDEPTDDQ